MTGSYNTHKLAVFFLMHNLGLSTWSPKKRFASPKQLAYHGVDRGYGLFLDSRYYMNYFRIYNVWTSPFSMS
jgi:hypothetical protein